MSRTRKNKARAKLSKTTKGHNAGKHWGENSEQKKSHFPHMQPAPVWIRPTGKKGWWNTKKAMNNDKFDKDGDKSNSKLAA